METRAETIQILSQIQTEINKAIGESQAQVAQSQNELNATKDIPRTRVRKESMPV